MANLKCPAENATTTRPKKPRTSKEHDSSSTHSFPVKDDTHDEDSRLSQDINADSLVGDITGMLQRQESEARKAKAFTTEFNKQVTQHHGDIKGRIEATKKIIEAKRRKFQDRLFPVLASLINGVDVNDQQQHAEKRGDITLGDIDDAPVFAKVSETLLRSEVLLKTYEGLCKAPDADRGGTATRIVFGKDKVQTLKAFEASKKMIINDLQAKLADKTGEVGDTHALNEQELHLARKILGRTKTQVQPDRAEDGTGIGLLIHDFGKMVGRLQSLIE